MLASESHDALIKQDFMSEISEKFSQKFLFLPNPFRLKLEKFLFLYFSIWSRDELDPGQDVEAHNFLDFKKEFWSDHLVFPNLYKAILDHRDQAWVFIQIFYVLGLLVYQSAQDLEYFSENLSWFGSTDLKQITIFDFVKNWQQIFEATDTHKYIASSLTVNSTYMALFPQHLM